MTRTFHAALAACTLALACLAAPSAAAQTGFEGVTTFVQHSKTDGKTTTMIQTTKGKNVRVEGLENGSIMIFNGTDHSMIMVEPEKKQYMTISQADMEQMGAMMKAMTDRMKAANPGKGDAKGERDQLKFDFSKTGRTETVAGTKCEVWHGSSTDSEGKKREGEACVAQGAGFALYDIMLNNPMAAHMRGSMQREMEKFKELASGGKGILKVTSLEGGKPFVEMEATKIERKRISDDAFKPPAGYTGRSMGAMMQQSAQQLQLLQQKMKGARKPDSAGRP
jgi:uncharacterized protein DUF4412